MKWFLYRWLSMMPFVLVIVWTGYESRNGLFGLAVGISLPLYAFIWETLRNAEIKQENSKQ